MSRMPQSSNFEDPAKSLRATFSLAANFQIVVSLEVIENKDVKLATK